MKTVRVLFVCTANICRSPTAEVVFRKMVADAGLSGSIDADSCAIGSSHIGDCPPPFAIACANERGYDLTAKRARQIRSSDFAEFDLLLGMDRDHIIRLRRLAPGEARIERLVDYATSGKKRKDISDPYGGDLEVFDRALQRIEEVMPALIATVRKEFVG